ncbi:MAG: hypothetical protein HZA48_09435 [Planctomycetes bacterium]|nr:hypothetical protein [Planctomycetota bacterium]
MIVYEKRASAILFNFLSANRTSKTYLLPANVCPLVPLVFLKAGVNYEFVDINLKTLCMDENTALKKLKSNRNLYTGVFFVRTYGIEGTFETFFNKIKQLNKNITIVDDKCLTMPDFTRHYYTSADVVLNSTGYAKCIDINFGGYGFISEKYKYCTAKRFAYKPKDMDDLTEKYKKALESGKKFRYADTSWLDNGIPPISFSKYKILVNREIPGIVKLKKKINDIYNKNLPKYIQLDSAFQNWRYNIIVPHKEKLLSKIFASKLFASTHYASLNGIFSKGRSKNAEGLHSLVVNLFNDRYYDEAKARQTARIINEHLKTI